MYVAQYYKHLGSRTSGVGEHSAEVRTRRISINESISKTFRKFLRRFFSFPDLLEPAGRRAGARALCCVLPPGGFFFFETLIALAKKKETIVDTDANFAQKYMSAGCHSWRSASFVCTLGTAWRMKVFVKKSIVNLMLRFVVCLLSLMFDVLLARADQ